MSKLNINYTTAKELASVWGITVEGARKRIAKLNLYSEKKEGVGRAGELVIYPLEALPEEIRKQIIEYRTKNIPSELKKELSELKDWQREIAFNRYKLLQYLKEEFSLETNKFRTKTEVLEAFLKRFEAGEVDKELLKSLKKCPSARTINRWLRQYNLSGGKITSLAPDYGKREGQTKLKEEEKEIFLKEYCRSHGLSARALFQKYVQQMAIKAGWVRKGMYCAMDQSGRTISYFTVLRYIQSISESVKIMYREGYGAFKNKVLPKMERNYKEIYPNQQWVSDGHTLNIFAKDDMFGTGKVVRPVVVAWMDMSSRRIMGASVNITENTDLISNSLANSITWNGNIVPENIIIDNGKAFKNKQTIGISRNLFRKLYPDEASEEMAKGLYGRLGIKVHFAIPYNPQSKPIERFWGTLDNYFSRMFPTYSGKNTTDKPEQLALILKDGSNVPLLSEVFELLKLQIQEYNSMPHTGKEMNGKTPDEVYQERLEHRTSCRHIAEKDLAVLLMPRVQRVVRNQGIKWNKWWYQDEMGLCQSVYLNRNVQVAYNPNDFSHIFVLDKAGRVLFRANRVEMASFDLLAKAKDMNEYRLINSKRKKIAKLTRQYLEAKGDWNRLLNTIEIEKKNEDRLLSNKDLLEGESLKDFGE